MLPKVELAKTRDFSETINDTFLFVRQNIKPLLKYYVTFCGFFVVAGTISGVLYQLKANHVLSDMISASRVGEYQPSPFRSFGIEFALASIFSTLTYITIKVTTLSYMALYKEKNNETPTADEMWGYIKYYYLRTLGSYLLLTILAILGLVFCLVPGIYLSPIFAMVLPIMIFENTSFGYAFNRCFILIKENWWTTFGAIIVIWIIVYVCMMVISLPASLITIIAAVLHPQKGASLALPTAIVTVILRQLCLVLVMLPSITISFCYFNLTEGKDGTSLLNRINKLGSIAPDTDLPAEEY